MALQDDDKKFIKDTVSEEISSELDKRDIGKSSEDVYKKNQENIEDRLNYLAERTLAGESTMAEKFELMKTAMKEAIPEDLKNVTAAVGQTFGKGGKQLAKGLSDLTGTVAKLTPLTAMLWKSRHIIGGVLGGVGNIIGGVGKLGWGVVKGVGGAAGSMLNAVANFGIKKVSPKLLGDIQPQKDTKGKIENPLGENVEETEQEESSLTNLLNSLEPSTGPVGLQQGQQMMQQKSQMEKQIAEIHSKVIGGKKDEVKNTQTMLKGIQGMDKTMKAVNGIMTVMKAKQFLILAGILAGVGAIVGLVKWFKDGGFKKLIHQALGQDETGKGTEAGKTFLDTQSAASMTSDEITKNIIEPNNNKDVGFTQKDIHKFGNHLWNGKKGGEEFRKYAKSLGVSDSILNSVGHNTSKHEITQSRNQQKTILTFPFRVRIMEVIPDKEQPQYIALRLNHAYYAPLNMGNASALAPVYAWQDGPNEVVYTKVIEQLFSADEYIPENTPVALLDAGYQILGDIEAFMKDLTTKTNIENYAEQKNSQMGNFSNNYKKARTDQEQKKHKEQAVKQANKIQNKVATEGKGLGAKVKEGTKDLLIGNDITEEDLKNTSYTPNTNQDNPPNIETVPGDNAGGPSVNEQNNNKLNNDINNTTKPQNKGTTPTQNKQSGSNNGGNTVVMANPQQGSQVANPAIVNMSSYEHMTPGRGNVNVGGR